MSLQMTEYENVSSAIRTTGLADAYFADFGFGVLVRQYGQTLKLLCLREQE